MGLVFLPLTNAAVSGMGKSDAGLASALVNTSQQVGGAVGLALLSTFATERTTAVFVANPRLGLNHALVAGFHLVAIGAGFAVLAAIVTILVIPRDVGKAGRVATELDVDELELQPDDEAVAEPRLA